MDDTEQKRKVTLPHAPEPVTYRQGANDYGRTACLLITPIGTLALVGDRHSNFERHEAFARHLTDCVNACAGINPGAVSELLRVCRGVSDLCGDMIDNITTSETEGLSRGQMLFLLNTTVTLLRGIIEETNDTIAEAEKTMSPT